MSRPSPSRPPGAAASPSSIRGLLAMVLLFGGCAAPPPARLQRLIEPEPTQDLDALSVPIIEVFRIAPGEALEGWQLEDATGAVPLASLQPGSAGGGLVVPPSWSGKWLEHPVEVPAAGAPFVQVELGDRLPASLTFCWAGEGQWFVTERCTVLSGDRLLARDRVDMSSHPTWRGDLRWLAVSMQLRPEEPVELRSVAGLGRGAPATGPVQAAKVSLDRVIRSAWVVAPTAQFTRRVQVPGGGRLEVALGVVGSGGATDFEIATADGDRTLFARELVPAEDAARWQPVEVDLDDLAGRTVDLVFRTRERQRGARVAFWGEPLVLAGPDRETRSAIVVSVDTLRADRLSLYGYRRATSPRLERWARSRGVVFQQAVSAAPWTLPAHVSLLSGLYPFRHGVTRQGPIPDDVQMLQERFRAAGYRTYGSVAGALLNPSYGFARGFDVFSVRADMDVMDDATTELERGVEQLERWLEENGEHPFFVFLHTYEPHTPNCQRDALPVSAARMRQATKGFECAAISPVPGYKPFESLYEFVGIADDDVPAVQRNVVMLSPDDRELVGELYDGAVAHVDRLLGRLVERLEASGIARRTAIVVTSDHGEALYERGHQGHFSLHDEALRVPLILAAPGLAARTVPWQVRTVDVVPTLLEIAGLPPSRQLDGQSLLPLARGAAGPHRDAWAYSPETGWGIGLRRRARIKYMFRDEPRAEVAEERLFDLARDPLETSDLSATVDLSGHREEAKAQLHGIPGIVVELSDPASSGLRVELTGPPATALVSSRIGPAPRLVPIDAGIVAELAAGGRAASFVLQDPHAGPLHVRLIGGSCGSHEQVFDGMLRGAVVELTCASGRWRTAAPGEAAAPSLRLAWTAAASKTGQLDEQDRRAREQELRALGYIR